jgi:hypothetical protein
MSCLHIEYSIDLILSLTSYLTDGINNIINAAFHMELLGEHMWGAKNCNTDDECRTPTLAKCGGEAQHLENSGVGVLRDSRMFISKMALHWSFGHL